MKMLANFTCIFIFLPELSKRQVLHASQLEYKYASNHIGVAGGPAVAGPIFV